MSPSAKSKTDGNNDITHANIIAIMIASLPKKVLASAFKVIDRLNASIIYIMQGLSV